MDVVYINQNKQANFICTACRRQWKKDVSKFYNIQKQIRLKVNCKCGNSWTCVLEKRRHIRKAVSSLGTYTYTPPGRSAYKGNMEVLDISLRGLKIKLDREWQFKIGELMEVAFSLDNKTKKVLKRIVVIKNIDKRNIGVSFRDVNRNDPDIGFYLL